MRLLDLSFDAPEDNLAFDEVLLDGAETGAVGETLRFWESPRPFVVLGVSQVLRDEIHEDACLADGVPILRRCSGGGCVLQGPGCLNFALAMTFENHPEIRALRGSYCYILNAICAALKRRGLAASHNGISDIVLEGRKISGNAQKRRKHSILHHGTLLYAMDSATMACYLREPATRPPYRGDRPHHAFVGRVPLDAQELRSVVREAFGAGNAGILAGCAKGGEPEAPRPSELAQMKTLSAEKYAARSWTRRR